MQRWKNAQNKILAIEHDWVHVYNIDNKIIWDEYSTGHQIIILGYRKSSQSTFGTNNLRKESRS